MPDAMYISPFRRAIMTQEITFKGWFYAGEREPGMDISSTVVRIAIEVCTRRPAPVHETPS
jgi:hypothetical protein